MEVVIEPWTTVRYRDGYGRDPKSLTKAFVELSISADRHARVVCGGTLALVSEGRLAAWVFPELCSHLRDAGFPDLPAGLPGKGTALLSIAAGAVTLQAWLGLEHRQVASLYHSILLLEAVASALSDGRLPCYKPWERPILEAPPVVPPRAA